MIYMGKKSEVYCNMLIRLWDHLAHQSKEEGDQSRLHWTGMEEGWYRGSFQWHRPCCCTQPKRMWHQLPSWWNSGWSRHLPWSQRHKGRRYPCMSPLIIGHIVRRKKTYQWGNTPTWRPTVMVYHLTVVSVGLTPVGIPRYALGNLTGG